MGVIDDRGQQWEHCNHCGKWVKLQALKYGWSTRWNDYVDLCPTCVKLGMVKQRLPLLN